MKIPKRKRQRHVSAIGLYDDLPDRTWGEIELTKNKWAKVDLADLHLVLHDFWGCSSSCRYARRASDKVPMHRIILGLPPGRIPEVDHRNGDGLDNRRSNLRIATPPENGPNQRPQRRATSSRFKGVSWHDASHAWMAKITVRGDQRYLGCYQTEEEAALVYNTAARESFGEFARPNVIPK
jgi:HNH endonuclease